MNSKDIFLGYPSTGYDTQRGAHFLTASPQFAAEVSVTLAPPMFGTQQRKGCLVLVLVLRGNG